MSRFPRKAAPVDLRVIKRPLKELVSRSEESPPKRRRIEESKPVPQSSPQRAHDALSIPPQPRKRGRPPGSKNKKTLLKEQEARRLSDKSRSDLSSSHTRTTSRPLRQPPPRPLTIIKPAPPPLKLRKPVEKKKRYITPPTPSPISEDPILPFGNRLTLEEADTERAVPSQKSKVRYERAKEAAEVMNG